MAKERNENVRTIIIGSVMNIEASITTFLAESTDEEIFHFQQRLSSLEYEARQLVNPAGQESE